MTTQTNQVWYQCSIWLYPTTHRGINLNPAERLALFYCQPWPQEFVNVIFATIWWLVLYI